MGRLFIFLLCSLSLQVQGDVPSFACRAPKGLKSFCVSGDSYRLAYASFTEDKNKISQLTVSKRVFKTSSTVFTSFPLAYLTVTFLKQMHI